MQYEYTCRYSNTKKYTGVGAYLYLVHTLSVLLFRVQLIGAYSLHVPGTLFDTVLGLVCMHM